MLWQLHVKNLAVISDLRLELKQGLTTVSGDEGAGKSLLVDALCLLTGGKASKNLIRTGTAVAVVEGIFDINAEDDGLALLLETSGIEMEVDGTLIISRELQEQGRSIARVNGRAVPVSLLREIGYRLIDIHSQMDHLSLLDSQRQMDLLDGYGGLLDLRSKAGIKISALRKNIHEIKLLSRENSQEERDLLECGINEIDQANIRSGEDESLEQEYRILVRVQELKEYCYAAHDLLHTNDRSAIDLVHQAIKNLERAALIDPALRPRLRSIEAAVMEMEETARDLISYMESVEDSPERLQQLEGRLTLLSKLKHKYGSTLEKVIKYAEDARYKLGAIESHDERCQKLEEEQLRLQIEAGELAEKLSRAREEAAFSLVKLVNSELTELGMPWTRFDIRLTREEREDGLPAYSTRYSFNQHGIDRVQFIASANPGQPMRPLADSASGGEMCRFMLALKSALGQANLIPTMVFDEIDAGVGGRNATTVGKKLAELARNRQVICITHLPQIACFGDRHYRVVKDVSLLQTFTSIEYLQGDCRVKELAAMLGGTRKPMMESARVLLMSAKESELELVDWN